MFEARVRPRLHYEKQKEIWPILCSIFALIFFTPKGPYLVEEIIKNVGVPQRKIISVICILLL